MLNQSIRYDGLLLSVGQDGNLKITLLFHTLLCSVSVTTLNNVVSCLGTDLGKPTTEPATATTK